MMPTNRTILTLALVGLWPVLVRAQAPQPAAPAATPAPPPTEAEALIDAAIPRIAALPRVSADIRQRISMLGQKFELSGQYMRDTDYRLLMKLAVSGLGDSAGRMLQVSDGTTLWDFRQVLESQNYTRFDIKAVMEKLNSPGVDPTLRETITIQLGFAGPETLLAGLRKSIRFDQKEEATLEGKPVYVLRGTWIDREGLTAPNGQPLPATMALPAYIPSIVTVWLGKDDGWPYQLLMQGQVPSDLAQAPTGPRDANGRLIGRPKPQGKVVPSRVELTYSNVNLNPDIPPDSFKFEAPPGTEVKDATPDLVGGLDEMIRMEAERAKQEAARVPTLNEGLDIPKPAEGATGFPLAIPGGTAPQPAPPAAPQ